MKTTPIVHQTRPREIKLQFPTTENILSWPIDVVDDGEFYDVQLVNVASYTIEGVTHLVSPSNPFAVTGGLSYNVSIIKTTNGQAASITLISRRAIKKSIVINVPDYGSHNGRYIWGVSSASNVAVKLDASLLLRSTYSGAGVWSSNALIATISLPALPTGGLWTRIHLKNNGDILVLGTVVPNGDLYGCLIDSNNNVWNIDKSQSNSYTKLSANSIGAGTVITASCYDFINNVVVYKAHGSVVYYCKLNNSLPNRATFNGYIAPINSRFNPVNNRFIGYTGYSIDNDNHSGFFYSNVLNLPNSLLYDYGYVLKMQNGSYRNLYIWRYDGSYVGYIFGSGTTNSGTYGAFSTDQSRKIVLSYPTAINSFCCYDLTIGSQIGLSFDIVNYASGSVGFTSVCCSPYTGYHFALGTGTNGKKRLIVIDPTNFRTISPEVGYLDLAYELDSIMTNHL